MDCQTFRDLHVAFVDDLLPGVELAGMERHLRDCTACSEHDIRVRRSLLLVHSLPRVELSADFKARLDARLKALGPFDARPSYGRGGPAHGAFFAVAAGVLAAAYLGFSFFAASPPEPMRLPPVIASRPAVISPAVPGPAIVASMPMGMPVWPAVMIAAEAPVHFAGAELPVIPTVSLDP
jgi:anti-sigma factor RsiW